MLRISPPTSPRKRWGKTALTRYQRESKVVGRGRGLADDGDALMPEWSSGSIIDLGRLLGNRSAEVSPGESGPRNARRLARRRARPSYLTASVLLVDSLDDEQFELGERVH